MPKQPPVTVGLRLPPSSKADLRTVIQALEGKGHNLRQEDVVGALLHRVRTIARKPRTLDKFGQEAVAQRARAKRQGF